MTETNIKIQKKIQSLIGTKIDTSHASENKARIVEKNAKELGMAWLGNSMNVPTKNINIRSLDDKIKFKTKEKEKAHAKTRPI